MKKLFFAVLTAFTVTFGLGAPPAMAWNWDLPHDPSAEANSDAVAVTITGGVGSTTSTVGTGTQTGAGTDGGWGSWAEFDAQSWGWTGGISVGFGSNAMLSLMALESGGEADASSNDVGAQIAAEGGALSQGAGDVVVIQQEMAGFIFAGGEDGPNYDQSVELGGSMNIRTSVVASSTGGNSSSASATTASGVNIETDVNP